MQYRLTKYSIKPGALHLAKEFINEVNRRHNEVYEILEQGSIVVDCSFLEEAGDHSALYIFLKVENVAIAKTALETKGTDIYRYIENAVTAFTESRISFDCAAAFDRSVTR